MLSGTGIGGAGGSVAVRAFGAPLGGGMIPIERAVHHRGSNLQHQMGAAGRPPHLLAGAHAAMQQPLHRALGGRRRDRLLAASRRCIVDDDLGLSGHIGLETTQHLRHLARLLKQCARLKSRVNGLQ
jgi:hypothetical protein